MTKIRFGVLCPSNIAFRRFLPALKKVESAEFVGIAHADEEEWFGNISDEHDLTVLKSDENKALEFVKTYGGRMFNSFRELILSDDIDAVYIPLPPALHYKWAKFCLENNKHVLVEKPSTDSYELSKELVLLAKKNNLALHENYMFMFHQQVRYIKDLIDNGSLGDVRLYRIAFGFPFRGSNDFRYNKKLGGGALLDCGGYTIKLANFLLGEETELICHNLNYSSLYNVDMYGSGTIRNKNGTVAQISFGMDNAYKCELEVWGSKSTLLTERIFSAPDDLDIKISIKNNDGCKVTTLHPDNSFMKSICYFIDCINDVKIRNINYEEILKQSKFVDDFKKD